MLEVPAGGLLGGVVPPAKRGQVALAGPSALVVGDGVVVVAAACGAAAAGEGAAAVAGLMRCRRAGVRPGSVSWPIGQASTAGIGHAAGIGLFGH